MFPHIVTQCFKAYDIRGQVPAQLNEDIAYRIGRAPVVELQGKIFVIDIGLFGTETLYFATSHNPKDFNGMKPIKAESRPISGDTCLDAIRLRVDQGNLGSVAAEKDAVRQSFDKIAYIEHLLTCADVSALKPLKILADPGNGAAGPVLQALAAWLPLQWVFISEGPDGHFPNGVPNPLLPDNHELTRQSLLANQCNMGLAWDGDFDRSFFLDADGKFIEGYYLVGLLAEMLLKQHPGSKIIHDPRLTWNTIEQVEQAGSIAIQSKTGHAFIKECMREEDAVHGGEMTAHHYFRNFGYCNSEMIPWLLVSALMTTTEKTLAQLVDELIAAYPCTAEINYRVADVVATLDKVRAHFAPKALDVNETDGVSMSFPTWRFNVRGSNTEALLRLNIESWGAAVDLQNLLVEVESLLIEVGP